MSRDIQIVCTTSWSTTSLQCFVEYDVNISLCCQDYQGLETPFNLYVTFANTTYKHHYKSLTLRWLPFPCLVQNGRETVAVPFLNIDPKQVKILLCRQIYLSARSRFFIFCFNSISLRAICFSPGLLIRRHHGSHLCT